MSLSPVYLHGIAVANPEFEYKQEEIRDFMLRTVADTDRRKSFVKKIYDGSAIDHRFSVLPDYRLPTEERTFFPKNDELEPEPSTAARNALFCVESNNLSELAVTRLFDRFPSLSPKDITHLVTVSCTGFAAPGFDFHLIKELGFNPGIHRFHIGFMGCFAAFPALKLAQSLCRSSPGARVLIVDVELCTLHFQKVFEPDIVVANALFADGAAAALVSADPSIRSDNPDDVQILLHDFGSHIIPGSEKDMAWIIGEHGFDMRLSSYVPRLIESHIETILDNLFSASGWNRDELSLWAIHPGGRAILDKTIQVLGLEPADLEVSYEILRQFGNMSSVTIFFVLQKMIHRARRGKLFSCAFGPGLTVESALMELV